MHIYIYIYIPNATIYIYFGDVRSINVSMIFMFRVHVGESSLHVISPNKSILLLSRSLV